MNKMIRFFVVILSLLAASVQNAAAHSVAQLQTTKYFHPDTVNMLITRSQAGVPGFRVGDTVSYIIEFTPVANGSNWGVQGYVTDYIPDGVEVIQTSFVTKDAGGNFVDVSPSLPGLSYDGWGARGQATFLAPFNVNTYDASGLCAAAAKTNNCNSRMSELQADTGIFYSSDPRTAQFPAMPTRIVQGVAGNGYNINPTRSAQLLPLLGGGVATTHNLWDADQTNAFGTTAANVAALLAPKSAQTALVATSPGNVPFNVGSPVAGPQSGYQLDNTGGIGPWQRIYFPGSRIGDATRGPAIAVGLVAGAVGGYATSTGWNLSASNPLPSGVNAVRWALGKLTVGEIKYVKINLRLTAPIPAAGLINASEVFGADTANGDPSTAITTGDNAWLYHIPSVADNNSNLLVLKKVIGYYAPATPLVLTPSDGSNVPMNAKIRYSVTYLNSGNAPQTNVVLSDTLPCQTAANPVSGITIISGPINGTANPVVAAGTLASNCTAAGRRTFSFAPTVLSLGPGSGGTLEYNVQLSGMVAATLYNVPNTAKLTSTDVPVGVTSNANATVQSVASPNLLITKTTSTPTVQAGGVATYTVTVSNTGTAATTGAINVYDFLPSTGGAVNALTRFSYLAAGSTTGMAAVVPTLAVPPVLAPYSTGGASANQQQILWAFATPLAAGASFSITYTATVGNNVPSSATPYYSSAAVLYTGGVTRSDNTSVAPVTVSSSLSLSSSIVSYWNAATAAWVPYSNFIPANAKVRYQLSYGNTGATDIAGANISALLPCQTAANAVSGITVSGVITVPAPNPPVTAAGNCATGVRSAFSFTAGTILAGGSGSVTFDVQTNAVNGNTVINTATLSGTGAASATSEVQTTVQSIAALNISKAQSVSAAKVGNTVTYTLTVTNTGTANATNIAVYDWLPAGGLVAGTNFSYVNLSSGILGMTAVTPTAVLAPGQMPFNTNVNAANMQELAWNFGVQTLAPGASFTITYNAAIGASVPVGNYGNYARVFNGATAITGTVATALNSVTVTGTGTSFLTQLSAGSVISIGGNLYTVAAIASATSLTLTKPYPAAGAGLVITKATPTNSNTVSMQVSAAIADLVLTMSNNAAPPVTTGNTLTYTIVLTNGGPDAAPGTRIFDAAVAGLSKNLAGISCVAAGGAACPSSAYLLASGKSDLESTGLNIATLPSGGSITLTIATTVTATGGTVTNSASAALPAGITEGNWATPDSASNTTTISASNLSTSTKTWLDVNGGDHMQGDVIRYTISLVESGGLDATGVSVTDALPANTTGPINVISFPAGATNGSTAGNLNITGITVAAGTTELIVFEVTIAAAAANGITINNTANVTNPGGTGATPSASGIVVAATAVPGSGVKNIYLYGSTAANVACTTAAICQVSRTKPTAVAPANGDVSIARGSFGTWQLTPVLQSVVTLSPTVAATVPVTLNLLTGNVRTYNVTVDLYCSATPAILITLTSATALTATVATFTFNLPLTAAMSCAAGSSWMLKVTNVGGANAARTVIVRPINGAAYSNAALPSQNVINVNSVTAYSTAYPGTTIPANFAAGSTAYLRAVVTDPFGSFDITSATVGVTDPNSVIVLVNTTAMPVVDVLSGTITTLAGTVGATANSATVTGVGTAFTTALAVGNTISINGGCYSVSAIASNTSLTLTTLYTGATAAGLVAQKSTTTTCITKTYEYAYAIPAGYGGGAYTVSVNAKEGTENTVSDTGIGSFLIPGLHHIELSHSGTGITCTPTVVTVKACANAACTTLSNSSTTVTLTPAAGWASNPITFTGSTTVNLGITTPQTVTLGASAITPTPSDAVTPLTCTPSCDVVFEDAGFIFSDTPTGASISFAPQRAGFSDATYYLRAVKTNTTTKMCESVLTGPQTVKFAYECNDPTTCYGADLLSVNGGSGSATIARNPNGGWPIVGYLYSNVSMNFDPATNHAAAFTFNYGDVGYITLRVKATANSATLLGNSNSVLVYPNDFGVNVCPDDGTATACAASTPDVAWLTGGGTSAFRAGLAFKATVTARICSQSGISCLPGTAAPSYGLGAGNATEQVMLTHALIAPTVAAGGTVGSLSGTGATTPLYRSSFSNGLVTLTDLTWSEVGVIELQAKNDTFYTNDLTAFSASVIGLSGNVGRFRPDHFDTVVTAPMTCTLLTFTPSCPGNRLVYSRQLFGATVTAKNAICPTPTTCGDTANYDGNLGFAKDVTLSAVGSSGGAAIPTAAPGGNLTATAVAAAAFASGSSSVTPPAPVFSFANEPTLPTDVFVHAEEPVGADGVSSLRAVVSDSVEGGVKVVSGRLKVPNAYGSERLTLTVMAAAQYYNGSSWVPSANDNTSITLAPTYDVVKNGVTTGTTTPAPTGAATLTGGILSIVLGIPTGGATGNATINSTNTTTPIYLPLLSGQATFGVYQGRNEFIYMRESY